VTPESALSSFSVVGVSSTIRYRWYAAVGRVIRVQTNIFDVTSGKLVWSGTSKTSDPSSVKSLVDSVGKEARKDLQKQGLIQYSRGKLTIVDRIGLEQAACECYGIVAAYYDAELGSH
jgi:hypothetical protein